MAFADCRQRLVDGQAGLARLCFAEYLSQCPEADDAELAEAMAEVAAALDGTATSAPSSAPAGEAATSDDTAAAAVPSEPFSVSSFVLSGAPELMLGSAAYGAASGFLAVATAVSAARIPSMDSLPALVVGPTVGAVAGLASSAALFSTFEPRPGDVALITSAMTLGTTYGVVLQGLLEMSAEQDRSEAQRVPWRFATVLGTGAISTVSAALIAPHLRLDPGDIGLANSAALWGAVLPLMSMAVAGFPGDNPRAPIVLTLASSLLAYDAALLLSPLVDVPRPATWLIEAGGVFGLLLGLGLSPVLAVSNMPGNFIFAMVTLATATGVAAGAGGCLLLDLVLDADDDAALAAMPWPTVVPMVQPDPQAPERPPLVGVALGGRF